MNYYTIEELKPFKKYKCKSLLNDTSYRFTKEDDENLFIYAKGLKTRGWYVSREKFLEDYKITSIKQSKETLNKKWRNKLMKIYVDLDYYKLWTNTWLPTYKRLIDSNITYDELEKMEMLYWSAFSYNMAGEKPVKPEDNPYLQDLSSYKEKYPFMFYDNGNFDTTFIMSQFTEVKIKKMNIPDFMSEQVAEAMDKDIDCTNRTRRNYDDTVSFSVNPETKERRLYYSEEYYDCGNGYYYIGISPTHAVFCEKD